MSSLDKPPPSRYRVEEKDGRLIVHDLHSGARTGERVMSAEPQRRPRSALDSAAPPVTPNPFSALLDVNEAKPSSFAQSPPRAEPGNDQEKAKRGAIVGIGVVAFLAFLAITSLWPIIVVLLFIAPIRAAVLGRVLPGLRRYIAEGSFN